MSLDYIRNTYGVPAKRGGRIRLTGYGEGVITGSRMARLLVRFDGKKNTVSVHPTWEVTYL